MSKDSKSSRMPKIEGSKKGTRGAAKKGTKGNAKKGASQPATSDTKKLGLLARLHMAMLAGIMSMTNPTDVVEDNAVVEEAKKGKGLSRVLNTPLVGRVVSVLVTVLTVLAILQASVFSSIALKNHRLMVEEREKNLYSLQSVESIKDTGKYGEIGDTVTTYLGDEGKITNVYPGVRSDKGKSGLGYYYAEERGMLRPATFGEVWRGSGLGGAFASALWVLMLILLLGSKRWFKDTKFDVKSRRWLWFLQIINGVLVVMFWLQFITPLVA